jgi:hypothetical protein
MRKIAGSGSTSQRHVPKCHGSATLLPSVDNRAPIPCMTDPDPANDADPDPITLADRDEKDKDLKADVL